MSKDRCHRDALSAAPEAVAGLFRTGPAGRTRRGVLRALSAALLSAAPLSVALLSTALPAPALAQTWPSRPVTIVSPYPAGGITDTLCRIVAEELSKSLGQSVLVENRPGAGGAIAMAAVARAAPDGYTLIMGGSAVSTIIPALNPSVTYHPLNDFEPVGYVAGLPIVMVAHPSIPAPTLPEFVAYAKANADKLNCAHHGPGTGTHLACVQFARKIGANIADVPYKGAPQVNVDLLTNRVQLYFGTLPTQIQYVRSGQLRAYGVASEQRAPAAPEIATLAEQGLTGMNLDSWNALYAPRGTPKPVLARLSSELQRILQQPEVRKRIEATGSTMRPGTAEDLRKLTTDEFEMYRKLAADTGIKLN